MCDCVSDFSAQLDDQSPLLPSNGQNSANRWTLWVGKDIRDRFDERKALLAPAKTHGGFVEMMLRFKVYLAEQGSLPVFDAKQFASSSQKRFQKNTQKNENQQLSNNYNYPSLFNFESTMTLNDPLAVDSSSYSYELSVNGVPAHDSELNLYSANTFLRQGLEAAEENMNSRKQKLNFDDSADTMHNLNDILNGIAEPIAENSFFQFNLNPHPYIPYENQNLFYNDGGLQAHMQMEALPDLGPFYQPVSFNIGDQVHEFGYIPNL